MSKRPSILIGVPCYGTVAPEILEDWMRFAFHCGRRLPQYDFFIGIRTKSEQFRARNAIVLEAQKLGVDWLLMLDDDMIINPHDHGYDLIEKLIAHDRNICGALYYQRTGSCSPVAMVRSSPRGYRFLRDDELEGGLQEVDVAGGGCLLIRMSIFNHLPQPFFSAEHEYGTDVQLCRAAQDKGFEVYLDSSKEIELGHVREERVVITSRNKTQYAMEQTIPGEARKVITSDIYTRLFEDARKWTGFPDLETMSREGQAFMEKRRVEPFKSLPDYKWYQQFPEERVARQVWFNTCSQHKRSMTEFILSAINDSVKAEVLDFGCGIGIPAFELARRGHYVTALDIEGTGTFDFLQWRVAQAKLPMIFHGSKGGVPALGGARFGAIIAMDCLEHIADWKRTLVELVDHLEPGGVLFCNNGILDDQTHPEHYPMNTKEFTKYCIDLGLMPFSSIGFAKPRVPVSGVA